MAVVNFQRFEHYSKFLESVKDNDTIYFIEDIGSLAIGDIEFNGATFGKIIGSPFDNLKLSAALQEKVTRLTFDPSNTYYQVSVNNNGLVVGGRTLLTIQDVSDFREAVIQLITTITDPKIEVLRERVPNPPTINGVYRLQVTVFNNSNIYEWVLL